MFRQKDLCPGPMDCPYVRMEEPLAGEEDLPCDGCPAQLLREYLESPGGRVMSVVIDLDFALQLPGSGIQLSQILYHEWVLIRQLAEERDKFQSEEMRKQIERNRHGG
jgi:hypothetical protein